jgi:hypothetical protein
MTRGARFEVDGRLGDVPCENVRGNRDSPQRDFGELVRLLIVPTCHVMEFYAEELVLEGPHDFAVRLHLVVMATRVLYDLVDHELRVSPHVEALDARLDGDSEATGEGLVLCHVV